MACMRSYSVGLTERDHTHRALTRSLSLSIYTQYAGWDGNWGGW